MTQKNFNQTGAQNFAVAGNWTPNGIPGSTDDAEINSGAVVASTANEMVNSIGVGSNNVLNIHGSSFTTEDGTGLNTDNGTISVSDASLFIADGTFDNPGTVALMGSGASAEARLLTASAVILDGGGTIEMSIGGGNLSNDIGDGAINLNSPGVPTLTNVDNTISGDGTVGLGLDFTNDGIIETNNSTSTHGGTLDLATDAIFATGGSFTNNGTVRADDGGTLIFGSTSFESTETFDNEGSIEVDSTGDPTKLEIAGNVTITSTGNGGAINLGGSGPQSGDEIISLNHNASSLTIIGQTLKGAGTIGDSNLTIDNVSGTIDAALGGQEISLGAPLFTNGGTLEATNGGILFAVDTPISNTGTISALSGGSVVLGSVLSPGAIDIGAGSSISLSAEVIGNISFTGDGAELIVNNSLANGGIDGEIQGAVATDSIDLTGTAAPYSSSNHLSWQQNGGSGVLSLISSSGQTIEALNLAGTFTSANFTMAADANQGTLIDVLNLPPPAATTADLIMDNTSGDYEIYDLGGNTIQAAYGLDQISTDWQVAGLGSFAGTDTSDMLMRDPGNGQLEIYDVSNNNISGPFSIGQVGSPWVVAGFGGFSGHANETDMLMRNGSTGQFEVYDISNNQITNAASMGQVGASWVVAGFGDFSGHAGETGDMLMRNASTGAFEVYDINNNQITFATGMGQVGLEWSVAGFGDFSGDANETDMLMRNSNTGAFEIYDISNNQIAGAAPMGQVGLEWQVVGFGPINGAGTSDMLMRNANTGAFEIYDIANNQLTTAASMGQVGLNWSVAGIAADPPGAQGGSNAAPSQLVQAIASFASSGALGAGAPLQQPTPAELTAPTVLTAPQA
jgi:hypothetical protein